MNINHIPAPLRALRRWVTWRMEPRFPGQPETKIPYDPRCDWRAKSNDPSTWTDFETCLNALKCGQYRGVMFALGDDAEFCGVDLDGCRDAETGVIAAAAMEIILALDSYSEVSQSGRGVKIIMRGVMPSADGSGKNYRSGKPWSEGVACCEMYRRGRFFALTGRRLGCVSADVEYRRHALAELYRKLYPSAPRPTVILPPADSSAMRRAANYIAKLPASVSGQRGHDRLLRAACVARRFRLNDSDVLALLREFNQRCEPAWPDREIERKSREAAKLVGAA